MLELFQYENCPDCRRVREKLSALMLDFVARQVSHDPAQRTRVELATGQRERVRVSLPPRGGKSYQLQVGASASRDERAFFSRWRSITR